MAEGIKVYKWWRNQLRIYLEGELLPKREEIAAIPGAHSRSVYYSQLKDDKTVPQYVKAAEIVVPESSFDQVKKILGIKDIEIQKNPELKTGCFPLKLRKRKAKKQEGILKQEEER